MIDLEWSIVAAGASNINFLTGCKIAMIVIAELDEYVLERRCLSIKLLMTYLLFLVPRFLMLVWLEVEMKTIITGIYALGVRYYMECHDLVYGCSVLMMMIIMMKMMMR